MASTQAQDRRAESRRDRLIVQVQA
jgi:hypothetical protein